MSEILLINSVVFFESRKPSEIVFGISLFNFFKRRSATGCE